MTWNHKGIKLIKQEVWEIRRIYATKKITHAELARIFNVSSKTILKIINRKTWKHL